MSDSIIIVARATGPLRAVRHATIDGERNSIESLQTDLLMSSDLGGY